MSDDTTGAAPEKPAAAADPEPAPPAQPPDADDVHEDPAGEDMPAEAVVTDASAIGQDSINDQLIAMLRGLSRIATGNVSNKGQTAIGDGAIAVETFSHTTWNLGRHGKSWRGAVPRAHIDRLVASYAACPSDEMLKAALAGRNVVYLSARPGWGRYAAAQIALAARHAHDRVLMIHVAPGERIVDAVEDDSYAEDHGHVVDATEAHSIAFMDLLKVDEHARRKNATVVVIGPLGEGGHDLGQYLVKHRRSSSVDVFRRQLSYVLTDAGKCIGECTPCAGTCISVHVDRCVTHPALRGHLNETMSLAEAARIAMVVGGAPFDADLDELLAELLSLQLRTQAQLVLRASDEEGRADGQGWGCTADDRRAFRLAYAALEGAPMASVYNAARQLLRIQREETAEAPAPAEAAEFELDLLLSDGIRAEERTPVRPGAPRVAQLVNPELVPAMLDVAWNERGLGPRLMRWLNELSLDPQRVVRERAAMMAGLLSFNDFDGVMDGLIAPWLHHARFRPRQAAGLSLLSCAHNPALHEKLQDRLRFWMDPARKAGVYARDSIAWAYAYGLGRELPGYAMTDLRLIAKDLWQRRSFLVAIGVEQTYTSANAEDLIEQLLSWVRAEDSGKRLRTHATRAFVLLAGRETAGPGGSWPDLLLRCRSGALDPRRFAELWTASLSLPPTAGPAWRAFNGWLTTRNTDPELSGRILDLVRDLCREPGLRSRLAHQRDHIWREQWPSSPLLEPAAAIIGRV